MDKTLEMVLIIMSAVFVLYTAMIDPMASLTVAVVAVICLVVYRMMFSKKGVKMNTAKKASTKKTITKKVFKSKKK